MKGFLSQNEIDFVERDISEEEALRELTEKYGLFTTPVVVVGDEVVVGFDRKKLQQVLDLS